ncbi:MAG: hypothetical protein V5804_08285 [Mucilaginibacter sp.]|uniref:hypothetical protein n=1 Tax=Mucilaginibacter sp. TaxID=1882438 RepID=UPI0034E5EA0C
MKLFFLLAFILISKFTFSQVTTIKRDTLYYLLDTAKIPINDRMIKITDAPLFKFYYFRCPCLDEGQMPYLIHRTNDKGEIIDSSKINKIKMIATVPLLYLFHKNYYRFNVEHIVYILEVLPDKKIIKHLVTTGAIALKM